MKLNRRLCFFAFGHLLLSNGLCGSLSEPGAIWQPLGPFGGPAEVVVTSPATTGLLLAGSPNSLLFRSDDQGRTWRHLHFPAELGSSLHAILPHPANAQELLVGVSPDSGGSGLYRSTDGGATWQPHPAFDRQAVWALTHFRGDARIIAAGAGSGVHLSRDGGATWKLISPPGSDDLRPTVSVAFDPRNAGIVYAGTPHLPWKTADGGVTWQSIHTGMLDDSDVFSIDVDPDRPARVFASACSGIYRSLNAGALWTKLRGSADASFRTYVIVRDPHAANQVWAGTTHGLMRSADGGATWQTAARHSVKAIAFDVRQRGWMMLATRDAGLVSSADGVTFTAANQGFANRGFFALAASTQGRLLLAGESNGVLQSANGGGTWKAMPGAPARRLLMLSACAGGRVFGAGPGVLTAETGTAWRTLSATPAPVRSIACLNAPSLVAASSRELFLSPDSGKTWRPLLPGALPATGVEWNQLAAAASSTTLLAATSHGLLRSADAGARWEAADGELGQATVSSVLFHPTRAAHAFAAQFDRVFASTDEGRSWRALPSRGLERAAVRALAILPDSPARLFALVAGRGVFFLNLE